MAADVQLDEPARTLYDFARAATPRWLRRITIDAARRGGVAVDDHFERAVDEMTERAASEVLDRLFALLATDVDQQRTNPLSIFREGVAPANELLATSRAQVPSADRFSDERFPDDTFNLGPAAWSDIDQSLHEPGLTWGAWKAMTVLQRRRDEGLR